MLYKTAKQKLNPLRNENKNKKLWNFPDTKPSTFRLRHNEGNRKQKYITSRIVCVGVCVCVDA